jgi:RNA polymerase sigma-70 factor (ECF subfamily)
MSDALADVEDLFRANYERLVRVLTAASGDAGDAADAVQEAFVQAYVHWRRVRTYDDPVAWIRHVALHRVLNARRSRERRARALGRFGARADEVSAPTEAGDRRVDVSRALAQLPPRQRAVVALHYFAQLSVREVADAMGTSEGTVKSQLHDARRALGRHLEVMSHDG